jgi:uncharacterized RDD family membrane protein YckC
MTKAEANPPVGKGRGHRALPRAPARLAVRAHIDTRIEVATPEGVRLQLHPAGPLPRAVAALIDAMIRSTLYVPLSFLLILGDTGLGLFLIAIFLLEWFYPVAFDRWNRGMSPGKQVVGIQVVQSDGTPITMWSSILRNLLRIADLAPFGYLAGVLSMAASTGFKRIGDHAAGSLVVYKLRPEPIPRLPSGERCPPPLPLDLVEQRAVIDFAERSADWTPERRTELAEIVAPLFGGTDTADRLCGTARWLVGVTDQAPPVASRKKH